MTGKGRIGTRLLVSGSLILAAPLQADAGDPPVPADDPLLAAFVDPPAEARPRVWWHWMNGNITEDGIAKDLAWMKRVGIGGAQTFDAAMKTPQIVPKRLVYMAPDWRKAFRFAGSEADRLGLELTIASSPGFTETGGPWVPREDGMKKLVWSETDVVGGRPFTGKLASPPTTTGPFQTLQADPTGGLTLTGGTRIPIAAPLYGDIKVLAWPIAAADSARATASYGDGETVLDGRALVDDDLESAVDVPRHGDGPATLTVRYAASQTIRSARLFVAKSAGRYTGGSLRPALEASDDGIAWRPVAKLTTATVPTTIAFASATARMFRVVFHQADTSRTARFVPLVEGLALGGPNSIPGTSAAVAPPTLKVADFRLFADAKIDRAEAKAAFDIVPDYFALPAGAPEVAGVRTGAVLDLSDRLRPDGTLDWTPPRGRWRVLRLGQSLLGTFNHPAVVEASGLEVDKLDAAAVRRYAEHYLGLYRETAGAELLGKRGVRGFLNDSIESGASNWTPRMIEQFERLRGYDPTPWLPTLTGTVIESRAASDRFLFDYRRTLSDLMASEHYGTIAKVAHENGLTVYGEALENQRPVLGDDLAMRRYADVPMAAVWTYRRESGPQPSYLVDMRGAASVASIYGKRYVAAESMTSLLAPWAYGPRDLKRVVDLEFASGINRPVIHTSVHVPVDDKKPGLSLSIFGQQFNRNEAWAELATPWIDYIARNSLLLQQGRKAADVAYFYGEEAPLTGLYSSKPVADAPKAYDYDFVNADVLTNDLRNDGDALVTSGGARYRLLYLGGSSRMMTLPALRRLAVLIEGGATVVGAKPVADPGLAGDDRAFAALTTRLWPGAGTTKIGRGQMIAGSDVESALRQIGVAPDFTFAGADDAEVLFAHRHLADGDSYFLSNRKDRRETGEARFRVTGKAPELWHAETGRAEAASYRIENGVTVVPLTLEPDGSVHVVFRKPTTATAHTVSEPELTPVANLDDGWTVAFESGRGAPASTRLAKLTPLNENADPRIRYFSGIATYDRTFATPRNWRPGHPLWLDLGEAREIAEVSINGKRAGWAWHAPYRLDIGFQAKPGKNRLTIRVANLWVNRMIGDDQPGADKLTWTTIPSYSGTATLRPSGLIGPVTLAIEASIEAARHSPADHDGNASATER